MTAYAADFSAAQLTSAQLKAAGFVGRLRYILGAGKEISVPEFADATTVPGHALALIQESYAQAAQGGYNVGRSEAQAAFGRAAALGWPQDRPIIFVVMDPNWLKQPTWPAIEQYMTGAATVAPVSRLWVYGSADIANHLADLHLSSGSMVVQTWPGDLSRANLVQLYYPRPGAPGNFAGHVDVNLIQRPDWGAWSAVTAPPAEEAAMASGFVTSKPGRYDLLEIGTDQRIYQTAAPTFAELPAATPAAIGTSANTAKDLSGGWNHDGTELMLYVHGTDDRPYLASMAASGAWTPFMVCKGSLWPGMTGPQGLAGHDGLAGPQGLPGAAGAAYDDAQAVAAVADALQPKAG